MKTFPEDQPHETNHAETENLEQVDNGDEAVESKEVSD